MRDARVARDKRAMFLNEAERGRRHAAIDAEGGGKALRERRLARAEVALKAHDVAWLQLGCELPRQAPGLLDRMNLKDTRHSSTP